MCPRFKNKPPTINKTLSAIITSVRRTHTWNHIHMHAQTHRIFQIFIPKCLTLLRLNLSLHSSLPYTHNRVKLHVTDKSLAWVQTLSTDPWKHNIVNYRVNMTTICKIHGINKILKKFWSIYLQPDHHIIIIIYSCKQMKTTWLFTIKFKNSKENAAANICTRY